MDAEMRPPYGLYGYYEYDLSRAFAPDRFASWVSDPLPRPARTAGDPHHVPELGADPDHIVVVMFERMRPSAACAVATLASSSNAATNAGRQSG